MLCSIYSTSFKKNNVTRETINFSAGLNTVVGTNNAKNSIGKTTFLLILDFIFGGDDYITNADNTIEELGHHEFEFTFKFENNLYNFLRSTKTPDKVLRLLGEIENKELSITEYREFLQEKYNINELSFRELVSGQFRIYNRDNHFEKEPLKSHKNENKQKSIERLIKIFKKFNTISNVRSNYDLIDSKIKALKSSSKFNYLYVPDTKKKLAELNNKILELELEKDEIKKSNHTDNINYKKIQTDQLYSIKKEILDTQNSLSMLENYSNQLIDSLSISKLKIKKDYVDLLELFPEINIKKLEELDDFHNKLNKILNTEITERQNQLQYLIKEQKEKLSKLESELQNIPIKANISELALNEFGRIESELRRLKSQKKLYDESEKLKCEKKIVEDQLNSLIQNISKEIEKTVNNQMQIYNDFICDGKKTSPILEIESIKKYTFGIPNDTGTGSQYRALIEYDLSLLNKTQLPCIIHDSIILKQTEDEGIAKILELYNSFDKQIFIAIDKQDSFPETAREIIRNTTILHLSPNGNELFGRAWNEKK